MTDFNLPPGVKVHHIPGNRPEDVAEEEFLDHIRKMLEISIGEARADRFFKYIEEADYEEVLDEYVQIAAGFASARVVMEYALSERLATEYERSDDETYDS